MKYLKFKLNWYKYCSNNPVNRIDPSGLKDYLVVLAVGINTDANSDYFHYIKNEMIYRMNQNGDNVRFLEVFPYGEGSSTSTIGQCQAVINDTELENHVGGDHVNWRITEANVQAGESIILIGHSGGGVSVRDAYSTMSEEYQQKVTQIVAIGSPGFPAQYGSDKTTLINDPNDLVPISTSLSLNYTKVDNWVPKPLHLATNTWNPIANYNNMNENSARDREYFINVHVKYFNIAQKAADILNIFWDKAVK